MHSLAQCWPVKIGQGLCFTSVLPTRWLPEDAELAHYHFDLPEGLKSVSLPPADNTLAPAEGSAPDSLQPEKAPTDGALSADGDAGEQPSTGAMRRALMSMPS